MNPTVSFALTTSGGRHRWCCGNGWNVGGLPGKRHPVFGQQRADLYEWTVGHGGRLRGTPDLYWASRNRPLHVQHGSSLQLGREHMRERIGARHLRARYRHLLVRADGDDLRQRGVQRRGWRGIVLHERMHGRGDPVSEHEPSDMRCRG